MVKIEKPIVAYSVAQTGAVQRTPEAKERPPVLTGATYKVKTPLSDHALYITINNCNGRPFEIFINSKAMEHFQWIVALTRMISAVFRKGGDVTFLVEEMRSVFDPKGGYFKKGGKYMPSLVAEIGEVIEAHLQGMGLLKQDRLPTSKTQDVVEDSDEETKYGMLCSKCNSMSVRILDGCSTCLNCGDSKCG